MDDMFAGLFEQHLHSDDINTVLYQEMDAALQKVSGTVIKTTGQASFVIKIGDA